VTDKAPPPLIGCNTGVSYRGRPYHVQTEDSGVAHPHVITHVFADGGRIIATRKTSYAEHLGASSYHETVRQLIRSQHKAMLLALRDGELDALLPATTCAIVPTAVTGPAVEIAQAATASTPTTAGRRVGRGDARWRFLEHSGDSLDEIILVELAGQLDE
jgi:hypothetical protein